jgi:hypothetical protein
LQLVSKPLQPDIRFFRYPIPALPQFLSQGIFLLAQEQYEVPAFRVKEYANLDACFRPEVFSITENLAVRFPPDFVPFWLERFNHFRSSLVTTFITDSAPFIILAI